jgi:Protein of unknown function (DUF3768)
VFDAFTTDNDPCGERDFGSFLLDGEKLFWKIDYVDKADPDPDLGAEQSSDHGARAHRHAGRRVLRRRP